MGWMGGAVAFLCIPYFANRPLHRPPVHPTYKNGRRDVPVAPAFLKGVRRPPDALTQVHGPGFLQSPAPSVVVCQTHYAAEGFGRPMPESGRAAGASRRILECAESGNVSPGLGGRIVATGDSRRVTGRERAKLSLAAAPARDQNR